MDSIAVVGGNTLNGTVDVSGSKNAALPILFSTLLADGVHRFENVPQLIVVAHVCTIMLVALLLFLKIIQSPWPLHAKIEHF